MPLRARDLTDLKELLAFEAISLYKEPLSSYLRNEFLRTRSYPSFHN